jgi:hypothetical protein
VAEGGMKMGNDTMHPGRMGLGHGQALLGPSR